MEPEFITFAFGGLLLVVAAIGGGFEIKEVKIPRVGAGGRALSLILGLVIISLGVGSSDTADRGAQPAPPQAQDGGLSAQAAALVSTAPAPAEEDVPEYVGRMDFTWTVNDVAYGASLDASRARGMARVAYAGEDGTVVEITQDLTLERRSDGDYYAGSNPREAASGIAIEDYMPDTFRVQLADDGRWYVSQACDLSGCHPVSMPAEG